MNRIWTKLAIAVAALFTVAATPALAQATRTWVSGVGDDANPCSRTAPCKTFAGAISKTAAGGEINTIDDGAYGAVTITKSITLRSVGKIGGVLHSASNGIIINAAATDRIVIDGLDINGAPPGASAGLNGIRILAARDVVVINCIIHGSKAVAPNGSGIVIEGTGQARVTVDNVQFIGNNIGISVKTTGAGVGSAKVNNSLFSANSQASISVTGANNSVAISGNRFYGSPKALELLTGATATTYGNNTIGTVASDAATLVPVG